MDFDCQYAESALLKSRPAERDAAAPAFDRPGSTFRSGGNMAVQRRAINGAANAASDLAAPPIVHDVLRSPGQPLDASTRSFMEPRFGHDFSQVRVHTDDRAAQSARAVQADGYTAGQNVVFGAGQYNPGTEHGQRLLTHELTHVVQQRGQPASSEGLRIGSSNDTHENEAQQSAAAFRGQQFGPASPTATGQAIVQRQEEGESKGKELGVLDYLTMSPTQLGQHVAKRVEGWLSNPRNQQFLADLKASVTESPKHVMEFLQDEVWQAIKEHWGKIVAVTVGLLVAEAIIGGLTAAPEPTLLTKVAAVILQIIVIAVLGYFAKVEVVGALEEGSNWYSIAHQANGAPALISDASRAFVRMVWHILLAVLALAGVRARIGGFRVPVGVSGGAGSAIEGGVEQGAKVRDISSSPKYVSHFDQPSGPVASGGATGPYYGGAAAPKFAPEPLVESPTSVPKVAPAPGTVVGKAPLKEPGIQPLFVPGVSEGTKEEENRKPRCGDPDLPWTPAPSLSGTDRGERMFVEPLTKCGPSGSPPSIRLPGWNCIQNAPKPSDGKKETDFWVHAHLLHGLGGGNMDLHGPGDDPRNLILTDKSLNLKMFRQVEGTAISLTHIHDQTLSYEVQPTHMANSGDRRYFADAMQITLKQIDPLTRHVLAILYDGPITSSHQRTPPSNCT